jgi:ATP phosphoribosyltransferase regulatory subunit
MTPSPISEATGSERGQIPHGVQDRFLVEAARQRQAEAVVRLCFGRWGYQEVIPPTFEYYENLVVGAGVGLQQAMYRFFDRQGHTLALRADFTPQVARMAATKLFDQPMPLRCFYAGSLFRYEEPHAGYNREFKQAGVELIGADTPAADAEVVALAVAVMDALALRDFQVNLGQMAFFRTLTADLPAGPLTSLREAVDDKNSSRLARALDAAGVTGERRTLLLRLPDLVGGPEVLDEARALSSVLPEARTALAAVERLDQVYGLLQAYGVVERVILDLGEVRGMDYYTGITFRGVAPGLGWPIISGGRYDDLIARFGPALPAVGFGLGIEWALMVHSRQGASSPSIAPHLLVRGCGHPTCLASVGRLRQQGCRVAVDPLGLEPAEILDQARRRGIPRTLRCAAEGWLLADNSGERRVTETALLREAEKWIT